MSDWRDSMSQEERANLNGFMAGLALNWSHVPSGSSKRHRFVLNKSTGELEEVERFPGVQTVSMFPYVSTTMAVHPSEVPVVMDRLRKQGVRVDFDSEGRPIITSAKQQDALAKAMGMKTGRDGYGHTDAHGNFQNSGRRRADEIKEGRTKVRKAIRELESMPDEVPTHVVESVLDDYDIRPTEENTG